MKRVLLGALLLTCSCATMKLFAKSAVNCAKQNESEILAQVPGLLMKLAQRDWPDAIEMALTDGGDVMTCALAAVAQAQHPAAQQAQAYMQANAMRAVNVPAATLLSR